MIDTSKIKITPVEESRISRMDFDNLQFGREYADHMFVMNYKDGRWQSPSIMPYQALTMSPATSAIHYGQSIFEGMKAFKNEAGKAGIFRPYMNIKRLNISARRMCMPEVPENLFLEGLHELLRLDKEWIPSGEDSSLYIRPFMFATDEYIGVKPSETYRFMIINSPVNAYYAKPVRVKVERHYTRAASGGTGYVKCAGNYGGSLYPARIANQEGFDQLLWTDAKEHKYVEESGTMNVMFVIDGKLVTPALSDTILEGVTRNSIITLAKDMGYEVVERRIEVQEVTDAIENGSLTEAFGCGTAAIISQIAEIGDGEKMYKLPPVETRSISTRIADYLRDLRKFKKEDLHNWMYVIE